MKITRIEHIAIVVADMGRFKRILDDTLGLRMEYEDDNAQRTLAMYPVSDTYLELIYGKAPDSRAARFIAEKGQGLHHICLEVEDLEGALEELRAKRVALLDERPRPGHDNTQIAFIDPRETGNVLVELVQRRANQENRSEEAEG